jgi:uncharacterized protein (DUF58 family)
MSVNVKVQPALGLDNLGDNLDQFRAHIPVTESIMAGSILGEISSRRQGVGYERGPVTDYRPGDRIRYIDHRQTAKISNPDDPTIKARIHRKGIKPDVWVLTDVLQSRYDADTEQFYTERELGLSATLGFMCVADSLGMQYALAAVNDDKLIMPSNHPMRSPVHLFNTARIIGDEVSNRGSMGSKDVPSTNLTQLLERSSQMHRESLIAVVSDFRTEAFKPGEQFSWQKPLSWLKSRGNSLVAVELIDPRDRYIQKNALRFRDPATSKTIYIDDTAEGQAIRRRYEQNAVAKQVAINDALASMDIPHIKLATNKPDWLSSFVNQLNVNSGPV